MGTSQTPSRRRASSSANRRNGFLPPPLLRSTLSAGLALVGVLVVVIAHLSSISAPSANGNGTSGQAAGQAAGSTAFGALVVHGHVLQTTDGGQHWSLASQPSSLAASTTVAYVASPTTRWVAASQSSADTTRITVAHTTDAGHTWRSATLPAQSTPFARPTDIQFVDSDHGWLSVDESGGMIHFGVLYATADGGLTWTSSPLPFSGTIFFHSASIGWLVDPIATTQPYPLAMTQDGGRTWKAQPLVPPAPMPDVRPAVGAPIFFDSMHGALPATFGARLVVYQTQDGGLTWVQPSSFAMSADAGMAVPLGATVGRSAWVFIGSLLLVTRDGGSTWNTVAPSGQLIGVSQLQFGSETTGWALTEYGSCASFKSDCSVTTAVLRTTDSGRSWSAVALPALP